MLRAGRTALGLGFGIWLSALAMPAGAQDAQSQAAEALYRQAKSLMAQEKYTEACEKFSASQSLEPGLGTLLYLGDCYERAGRFASALATFQEAQEFAKGRNEAEREHLASVRAAALEPRVPRLELRLGADELPDDLQITLNGTPVERRDLNRPMPHDAGTYEVHFSAPGFQTFTTEIELRNGESRSAVVKVPRLKPLGGSRDAEPVRARGPRDSSGPGDTQRTVGWIVGAAGLALGIGSGVFTYLAASRNSESKNDCDPNSPNRCSPSGVSARQDAKDLALAATVAGVAGGIGLAGGLVLHLSAPSSNERGVPDSALLTLSGPLL
jgi:serine/threonine-protein kinase